MVNKNIAVTADGFNIAEFFDENLLNDLLTRASVLNGTISDIPLLPQQATEMDTDIAVSSIFATAALDGNTLTKEEVASIYSSGTTNTKPGNTLKEINNLIYAYRILNGIVPDGTVPVITQELIKSLHKTLTAGIDIQGAVPGEYRDKPAKAGAKRSADIEGQMAEFIEFINHPSLMAVSPYVRAAAAHAKLTAIHPFFTANGRTARLVEAYILCHADMRHTAMSLSICYHKNSEDYFNIFSASKRAKRDITPFIRFVLEAVNASLDGLKDRVYGYLYDLTMREYLNIMKEEGELNQRQLDLVLLMMDGGHTITLASVQTQKPFSFLYSGKTEQTARRDLKKLTDMKILTTDDNKEYKLGTDLLCFG
ncbi:Fic family protein [Seleniivibrio woodruffii]|uniref:Fic family protein n=1 Tax=Seleniivibrio woodruffii TaxID=1078050 RepID=UPI0039E22783